MKDFAPRTPAAKAPEPATSKGVALMDNRASTVAQRKLQEAMAASPRPVAQRQAAPPAAPRPNRTGLPDKLKAGVESLSGHSLDDVKVHYNSAKPAQLQAHAYAQGTNIHLGPGQEKYLPHEAWHVVQQKQGRVRLTEKIQGSPINTDYMLEREADVMGSRANTSDKNSKYSSPSAKTNKMPFLSLNYPVGLYQRQVCINNNILKVNSAVQLMPKNAKNIKIESRKNIKSIHNENKRNEGVNKYIECNKNKREKVMANKRIESQSNHSPIKMVRENARETKINNIKDEELDFLQSYLNYEQYLEKNKDGNFKITVEGKTTTFLETDEKKLREALEIITANRYQEAEPRSGKSRAAPDLEVGNERSKNVNEAGYSETNDESINKVSDSHNEATSSTSLSTFTTTHSAGIIQNTITHKGPWAKGIRNPSQAGVMGGQNAKNYFVNNFMHPNYSNAKKDTKQKTLDNTPGRYEWLHIIGSSLGGPNIMGNLVCGTYDANTKMIALEHRVALWGKVSYGKEFKPTTANPIKIVGTSTLIQNTYIANKISLQVFHGSKKIINKDYNTLSNKVLTKSMYVQEENNVDNVINKNRPAKALFVNTKKNSKK